ncbi:hypothetical protein RCL1_002157 [Eukaryota sp. TZLM3-RCL]
MHPQSSLLKKQVEVFDVSEDEGDVDCVPILDNRTSIIQEETIVDLDEDKAILPSEAAPLPVSLPLSTVVPSPQQPTASQRHSVLPSVIHNETEAAKVLYNNLFSIHGQTVNTFYRTSPLSGLFSAVAYACQNNLSDSLLLSRVYYTFQCLYSIHEQGKLLPTMLELCIDICNNFDSKIFFVIQGSTGSGKSTILSLIIALLVFPLKVIVMQSKRVAVLSIVQYIIQSSGLSDQLETNTLITASFKNSSHLNFPPQKTVGVVVETVVCHFYA